MMEDIVLLETKLARPRCDVFALRFAVGEFDMVVADPERLTCELYEIKHSGKRVAAQRRHLLDEAKCARAEHRWGTIAGKYVIYRGEAAQEDGVTYLNVEDYLNSLEERSASRRLIIWKERLWPAYATAAAGA